MLTRVARTATAVLSHTFVVGEVATDSTTTVTVTIERLDGTTVASGNATSAGVGTGTYTFTLPSQAQLDALTVDWAATIVGAAVTERDHVEICGGFLFTLAEARASDPSLADTSKYTAADLRAKRQEVEEECERICDRAFVPRYQRAVLDGTGTTDILLADVDAPGSGADIRTIRSVSVAPRANQTFVALTAGELAALVVTRDRALRRVDSATWTEGVANIVVEYEFGLDAPPAELERAALTRLRTRLNIARSAIPDRASSFTAAEGGTYRLDMPGAWKTGLPEVDAVYARYSLRSGAGTGADGRAVPASRQLNYDPQHWALYHGGVR